MGVSLPHRLRKVQLWSSPSPTRPFYSENVETDAKHIMSPREEAAAFKFFAATTPAMHKFQHFQDFLKSHGLLEVVALPNQKLKAWFHNHKKKRCRTILESSETLAPASERSVTVMRHTVAELQRPFPEELDALIVLPDTPLYRGIDLDATTQCILLSCRGMLNTLARTTAPRLYISVDTFMAGNPGERGVLTVSLLTKKDMRKTSMYKRSSEAKDTADVFSTQHRCRVQCKAHTTQALPVLNAPLGEESGPNHVSAFQALKALWSLAQPENPPLETMLSGI